MASHPLDNPVWSALDGPQAALAVSSGRFVRYREDMGLFLAADDPSRGFADLAPVLPPGTIIGIVTADAVDVPAGMDVVEIAAVPQMVATHFAPRAATADFRQLREADVPAMLELTGLTHPGPFLTRTIDMGRYLGIFDGPRLVAMAGERMHPPGYTEISAVCTHPDYQGRGYAKALMSAVGREIVARRETPFLHVRAENAVAIGAYRALGFEIRREMTFTVLRKPAA